MNKEIEIDKKCLKGKNGGLLTQGLFLELSYANPEYAIFTLGEEDKEYKGKNYISLKTLYMEMEDVLEHTFATTYLYSWEHWMRMCNNKNISRHIEDWRDELEIKVRSRALMDINAQDDNLNANKFIANGEWKSKKAGRPSKKDKEKEKAIEDSIEEAFGPDILRFEGIRK